MAASTASAALVAHYTFDESSGTMAYDSAGSNDGTIHGATWTNGPSAGALNFNPANNAYVAVPSSPSLSFTQSSSFTIALWANTATNAFQLISKMQGAGQTGLFTYELDYLGTGVQAFHFKAESSNQGVTAINTGMNSTIPGTWYHVAAVYNNKNMQIYLNGALKDTATFSYNTGSTSPDGRLMIGAREVNGMLQSGWYYNGSMDDVRIYNEALSASYITQLYQTTPEPATMGLLGLGGLLLRRRMR